MARRISTASGWPNIAPNRNARCSGECGPASVERNATDKKAPRRKGGVHRGATGPVSEGGGGDGARGSVGGERFAVGRNLVLELGHQLRRHREGHFVATDAAAHGAIRDAQLESLAGVLDAAVEHDRTVGGAIGGVLIAVALTAEAVDRRSGHGGNGHGSGE